jgi:hypothetical protein
VLRVTLRLQLAPLRANAGVQLGDLGRVLRGVLIDRVCGVPPGVYLSLPGAAGATTGYTVGVGGGMHWSQF